MRFRRGVIQPCQLLLLAAALALLPPVAARVCAAEPEAAPAATAAPDAATDTSAPTATPEAAAPAPEEADEAYTHVYHLDLSYDYPVVTDYVLNGMPLHPLIDTGAPGSLALPPAVYDKLDIQEAATDEMTSMSGTTWDAQNGLAQVPLLGSGRVCWRNVMREEPDADDSCDSIFPLDMLDCDYAMFLLSRNELWLSREGPGIAAVAEVEDEMEGLKYIPYFECMSGIFVSLSCGGRAYAAQIDTGGAGETLFYTNFVAAHPELFTPQHDGYDIQWLHATTPAELYTLAPGVMLQGISPEYDVPVAGSIVAIPGTDSNGDPVGAGELGDPASLPYARADGPGIAPVALICMDVLGQYDFCFDLRNRLLILWPQSETHKLVEAAEAKQGREAGTARKA